MNNYSRVDWKVAGGMLAEGCTFQEIADRFGVTRQCIQQYYTKRKRGKNRYCGEAIPYPAFRTWFQEKHMSFTRVGEMLWPESAAHTGNATRLLTGKTKFVSLDKIWELSKITGLTFEEMFQKEDGG